jgi:heme exporter protein CcmD
MTMAFLGAHSAYIAAAYLSTVLLIGGLAFWIIADHRRQARKLAEIDPRQRDGNP